MRRRNPHLVSGEGFAFLWQRLAPKPSWLPSPSLSRRPSQREGKADEYGQQVGSPFSTPWLFGLLLSFTLAFGYRCCRFTVILRWHRRLHIRSPGDQPIVQFFGFVRHVFGEVLRFTDVIFEVVKFQTAVFEELHELPIAGMYETHWSGSPEPGAGSQITRKVLEDGITLQLRRRITEQSGQTFAVQHLTRLRGTCDLKKRGKDIHVNRWQVARRTWLRDAGHRTMNGSRVPPS